MSEFTIETTPIPETNQGSITKNSKELIVGNGKMTVNGDGFFLGAEEFADAPFSVDYDGNMKSTTGIFSGETDWANVQAGTNANALNVGAGNVKIDGANKRIVINDGTNDRVLIGYLSGKF